jgi:hypothetical protein
LTLINEYTDWTRPVEHPINLLDSLLDIMSDALVVAPVIETGDLHSRPLMPTKPYHRLSSSARPQTRGKTFFYVFVHQVSYMTPNDSIIWSDNQLSQPFRAKRARSFTRGWAALTAKSWPTCSAHPYLSTYWANLWHSSLRTTAALKLAFPRDSWLIGSILSNMGTSQI